MENLTFKVNLEDSDIYYTDRNDGREFIRGKALHFDIEAYDADKVISERYIPVGEGVVTMNYPFAVVTHTHPDWTMLLHSNIFFMSDHIIDECTFNNVLDEDRTFHRKELEEYLADAIELEYLNKRTVGE